MTTSAAVFEKVAAREMTPEDAADLLMKMRDPMPRKPGWMPRWVWIVGVLAVAIVFAPVLSSSNRKA